MAVLESTKEGLPVKVNLRYRVMIQGSTSTLSSANFTSGDTLIGSGFYVYEGRYISLLICLLFVARAQVPKGARMCLISLLDSPLALPQGWGYQIKNVFDFGPSNSITTLQIRPVSLVSLSLAVSTEL